MKAAALLSRHALILTLLFVGGCSLAPSYRTPASPVPAQWPAAGVYRGVPYAGGDTSLADIDWHDFFADARLRAIIAMALENNRDLRVAVLNIEKARAQYRIRRAEQFPAVDLQGTESAGRTPASVSVYGVTTTDRRYDLNVGVTSYEVDLFGRVASLKDEALQRYLATAEARRSQQISLVAEVASRYLTMAADMARLKLSEDTLATQLESYRLVESRWRAGAVAQVDVYQARTSVESARGDAAAFRTRVAQDRNALDLLAGAPVAESLLPGAAPVEITALQRVPAGLPSSVLVRRPDILQAERLLRAANADIGAARAAFFPRIVLTASAGGASDSLSGLFKSGAEAWSFAPAVTLPIFDAGANIANLDASKAQYGIALAQYEQAIQQAFREVADALAERGTMDERLQAQDDLVDASIHSYRVYDARYRKGADTYLDVLIAQRSMYAAQQQQIGIQLARQLNSVTLYKTLGGGW